MQLRQLITAAFLALGLSSGIAFAAESEACPGMELAQVKLLSGLLPDLRVLLGADRVDYLGIADRGEKFNSTDVIVDATPMRRFVLAGVGDKCAVVALEQGGRAHYVEMRLFALTGSAWKEVRRKILREAPSTVQELVAHAGE